MKLTRIALLNLPLAALAAAAAPAAAQDSVLSLEGRLMPCPASHRVPLEAGRRYVLTAASTEFDTILQVYRDGTEAPLAQDDDGGDGTDSRLDFAPPESGDYLLCVSSYGGRGGGAYTVGVGAAAPLPPPATRPTGTQRTRWRVYEGALGEGDLVEGERRFDDYEIALQPGERALIALDSGAFDPVLNVYAADQRGGQPAASDDDGGGNLNAFVLLAPPEGGTFIVRAGAFSAGASGPYRLRVATEPVPERGEEAPEEAE